MGGGIAARRKAPHAPAAA